MRKKKKPGHQGRESPKELAKRRWKDGDLVNFAHKTWPVRRSRVKAASHGFGRRGNKKKRAKVRGLQGGRERYEQFEAQPQSEGPGGKCRSRSAHQRNRRGISRMCGVAHTGVLVDDKRGKGPDAICIPWGLGERCNISHNQKRGGYKIQNVNQVEAESVLKP